MIFNRELRERLREAEAIVYQFHIMLEYTHLADNKSLACEYARREIKQYKEKYDDTHSNAS